MTVAADSVTAGAIWRASLTPTGAESADAPSAQPRVIDFAGMTPAAAARAYNRVLAQRQLTSQVVDIEHPAAHFVNDRGPSADTPGSPVHVADPIAEEPKIDYGGHNYAGGMPPPKPQPEAPAQTTPPPPTTQSQPSTNPPPPPTGDQLGKVPVESSPIPAQPSESEDTPPLFDRPDLSGKKEGDRWTEVRDGFTHTYTIPVGNGNKSVDHEVTRGDVLIGTSRVAYGENGGVQQWVDIAGSASLYAEQESSGSNQYTQMFNPGTSTSGLPDSTFGTLPDLKTTFVLVDNGVPIGSLETISSEPGLAHTAYVNRAGDVSIWRTNETEHGGLVTNPIKYVDRNGRGWYAGNLSGGPLWQVSPKLDGSSILTNTEEMPGGTHFRVWDPLAGIKTDRFSSSIPNHQGYLWSRNADGTTSIEGDDGSSVLLDPTGNPIRSRLAPTKPDRRSNWQKFTEFSSDIRDGFGLAYDETKKGIAGLLGQDGSLKEAWLGLATSGVGLGVGLAVIAIDLGEIATGTGSWNRLGRDIVGTGNELSILAIGADWTQFDDAPGETIGRGLFGTMLLLGPKGIKSATGKLPPPSAVQTAFKNAANNALANASGVFANGALPFGRPALTASGTINFPGTARLPGPTTFAAANGSTPTGGGTGRTPNVSPDVTTPSGRTSPSSLSRRADSGGSAAAPLLPAEIANAGSRQSQHERAAATTLASGVGVESGFSSAVRSAGVRPGTSPATHRPPAHGVITTEVTLDRSAHRAAPAATRSGAPAHPSQPASAAPGSGLGSSTVRSTGVAPQLPDVALPDGTTLGTRQYGRTVHGDVEYYADSVGDPMAAVARLDPPTGYKKIGLGKPKPIGFVDGMDNRGHMIPEAAVRNQRDANVQANSIAEHASLNLGAKSSWERAARKYARVHSGVTMVSVVLERDPATRRPVKIKHSLFDSGGMEIPGFTVVMYNPTTPGRAAVRTDPPNPKYPSP